MAAPTLPPEYRCLEKIASGTYGVVWKVLNRERSRCESLKVLHRIGSKKWQLFCRVLSSLKHPNIAEIHYLDPKGSYFIMEYLGGGTLASLLDAQEFPLFAGLDILKQVAEGLQYSHSKGVFHRDLKPHNVLFSHRMVPKIVDFGITRAFEGDDVKTSLGTPQYMSPEQWENADDIDYRADIWAWGIILYQFLALQYPFPKCEQLQLAKAVATKPIIPPSQINLNLSGLGKAVESICMRALEKDREKRYQSAGEIARKLGEILANLSSSMTVREEERQEDKKEMPSLMGRVRMCYGFATDHESKNCSNRRCKKIIAYRDIIAKTAFYDRVNKRYWCHECFAQMKPILGRYPVLVLDRRGTSTLYVVWDRENKCPLLLRKSIKESREMVDRGRRVLAILAAIECDLFMKIFAWEPLSSRLGNEHYMIKQYNAGRYVNWLQAPLSYEETLYLLVGTADTLYKLHQEGLVHRSVTPSSVFLDSVGNVLLGNFVLTKFSKQDWLLKTGQTLTQADTPLGVLEYMSPEQIDCASEVDQRTDIWSFGVLAYYLITGNIPFSGKTFMAKATSIKNDEVKLPSTLPEAFAMIIEKCLRKNKEDRYLNIEEVRRDLENLDG